MNSEESGGANMKEDWGLGEGAEEEETNSDLVQGAIYT